MKKETLLLGELCWRILSGVCWYLVVWWSSLSTSGSLLVFRKSYCSFSYWPWRIRNSKKGEHYSAAHPLSIVCSFPNHFPKHGEEIFRFAIKRLRCPALTCVRLPISSRLGLKNMEYFFLPSSQYIPQFFNRILCEPMRGILLHFLKSLERGNIFLSLLGDIF